MRYSFPHSGLYAITPTKIDNPQELVSAVAATLRGGARAIQFRDKSDNDTTSTAKALLSLCREHNVPLIINDNIDLAQKIGAEGVHLGQHDLNIAGARTHLADKSIIGVSCYNSVTKAQAAQQAGADYVAFGRFFLSQTKPNAPSAELTTLAEAKLAINIPIVAIGGILPENGSQLIQAGANVLAVIGGIFDPKNTEQATREYQHLF